VRPTVGFWDPLGPAAGDNAADFARRREVEMEHGRVAAFVAMGYVAPESTSLYDNPAPFCGIGFEDGVGGLAAPSMLPALGLAQMTFPICVELFGYRENIPGDYGAGFLGLRTAGVLGPVVDEETCRERLNAEISNSRLTMHGGPGLRVLPGRPHRFPPGVTGPSTVLP